MKTASKLAETPALKRQEDEERRIHENEKMAESPAGPIPAMPHDHDSAAQYWEHAKKHYVHARHMAEKHGVNVQDDSDSSLTNPNPALQANIGGHVKMSELETTIGRLLDQKLGGAKKQQEEFAKFAEEAMAQERRKGIVAFCEAERDRGNLMPRDLDVRNPGNVIDHLMTLDAKEVVCKFSENGKTIELTQLEQAKRRISQAGQPYKFSERLKTGDPNTGGTDLEKDKVEQHYDSFSEDFRRLHTEKKDFLEAFEAKRKRVPDLTAEQFLKVRK